MHARPISATGVIAVLLLAANLAMVLFIFPLPCVGTFALTSLICALPVWIRSVYDPVYGIWEFTTLRPAAFDSWAQDICDSQRRARSIERFLKTHHMTTGRRWLIALSRLRACLYVHARWPLLLLPSALLMYGLYQVVGGHTVVWTSPRIMGAVTGAVWGFSVRMYWCWRTAARIRQETEQSDADTVKST